MAATAMQKLWNPAMEIWPQSSVVDSLTQAFTPQKATSPAIEGQIAELINNMLVGDLLAEMVKDRVKHPPPENCENLSVTMVNEETRLLTALRMLCVSKR